MGGGGISTPMVLVVGKVMYNTDRLNYRISKFERISLSLSFSLSHSSLVEFYLIFSILYGKMSNMSVLHRHFFEISIKTSGKSILRCFAQPIEYRNPKVTENPLTLVGVPVLRHVQANAESSLEEREARLTCRTRPPAKHEECCSMSGTSVYVD